MQGFTLTAESTVSTRLLIARSQVEILPGARFCVLEQDTSASLLSTGSTQENAPT